MKDRFCLRVAVMTILACAPLDLLAQNRAAKSTNGPAISATFTFSARPVGCVGYHGEPGDDRFYIEFPTSNPPKTSFSAIESAVEIRKETDKSNTEVTVYSIAFRRGTSPRFGPGGSSNELVLIFTPAEITTRTIAETTTGGPAPVSVSGAPASAELSKTPAATPARFTPGSLTANPTSPQTAATPVAPGLVATSTPPTTSQGAADSSTTTPPAQTKSVFDEAKEKVNLANIDLSVPESPAFTVLGLTPETIVRPTSPRQFASSLLNGVDQRGNFQSGIALDFAPYMLYAGDNVTLQRYRQSYATRLLARMQTSFATTKGSSENDKSLRLALGLHLTLMDKGDPHSDAELMKCFSDSLTLPLPPLLAPPIEPGQQASEVEKLRYEIKLKEFNEELAKFEARRQAASERNVAAAEDCRAKARKRNWNRSSWVVAAAPSWISSTGKTSDYTYDGGGVWTSLSYGFEGFPALQKMSQLIVHARYRNKEMVPEPDMEGKFFRQDSIFVGARLRAGTENSAVSFEGVSQHLKRVGSDYESSSRFAFGLERKIAENMWFHLAFGSQGGAPDGKNKGFVLTTFKWGFSEKRTFATPGQ